MYDPLQGLLAQRLADVRASGLYKQERLLDSAQGARVRLKDGREALNLCANNYLGLANHPQVKAAAAAALERWGYGLGSVRFICGTQAIHRELEEAISDFLGTEDTILYSSCWDANGGLFETILGPEDAVISDALNHASIIDGKIAFAIDQQQYAQGYMSVVLLYLNLMNGHELGGGQPIYTGPGFVTKDNVATVQANTGTTR